jgi:hypothetical protein
MMFVSSGYPALAFILVAILISESPRWLFRHQRRDQALAVLAQDRPLDQAKAEVAQMEQLAHAHGPARSDSIFQRRYLLPLVLAITLLAINQATGIGAVFTFPVIMLNQAGLSEQAAAQTSVWLAITNVLVTVLGVLLIDRWGRKVLLKIGTTVIMLALAVGIATYWRVESGMTDVTERLQRAVNGTSLTLPFSQLTTTTEAPAQVSILYAYDGHQQPLQLIRSDVSAGTVSLSAPAGIPSTATLEILRAKVSLAPSPQTGSVIFACLILYIAGFAFGPGVCLWVMSSEMLPTRIRSLGMGLGVLGNAGVTVLTTALFLPTVGNFGYAAMWAVWFLCTLAYFLFAAFILPETKGRSLEEIEAHFSRSTPTPRNAP